MVFSTILDYETSNSSMTILFDKNGWTMKTIFFSWILNFFNYSSSINFQSNFANENCFNRSGKWSRTTSTRRTRSSWRCRRPIKIWQIRTPSSSQGEQIQTVKEILKFKFWQNIKIFYFFNHLWYFKSLCPEM